jgi:hypothetical protein
MKKIFFVIACFSIFEVAALMKLADGDLDNPEWTEQRKHSPLDTEFLHDTIEPTYGTLPSSPDMTPDPVWDGDRIHKSIMYLWGGCGCFSTSLITMTPFYLLIYKAIGGVGGAVAASAVGVTIASPCICATSACCLMGCHHAAHGYKAYEAYKKISRED